MNILLVEPFYSGSHQKWVDGLVKHSRHQFQLLTLPGRHWKWRMHGGAVTLARQFEELAFGPDLILTTDMLDLTTFLALTRKRTAGIPVAIYFHENQITYPWSNEDQDVKLMRDNHYGFINFTSALAADRLFFNSDYHLRSFFNALPDFLAQFPDHNEESSIEGLRSKGSVLHLGLSLSELDVWKPRSLERPERAVLLWNHRWEYDKNPEQFFRALFTLKERGQDFGLIVLGERFKESPPIFEEAKQKLAENILHLGYAQSLEEYAKWLYMADILPVTSNQDFFGGSVVESIYCNVKPLLPKRLAYPEHIPESLHSTFFYDEDDFTDRLHQWIKDVRILRDQKTRSFVEKYDWTNLIRGYDDQFELLGR